jgi:hypothetical protein
MTSTRCSRFGERLHQLGTRLAHSFPTSDICLREKTFRVEVLLEHLSSKLALPDSSDAHLVSLDEKNERQTSITEVPQTLNEDLIHLEARKSRQR